MTFEICATNLQSCKSAKTAGASRIELCTALDAGGMTPSAGLIRAAVKSSGLPVHVLIRPREGDFFYSKTEIQIMLDDIRQCRKLGAAGVVVGVLKKNGRLDLPVLKKMLAAARPMEITCHRAFDCTPDPFAALEDLILLGFDRILTSGQTESAFEGKFLIQKLVERAAGRIQIQPGAGIHSENIGEIRRATGAENFHFTAKTRLLQKTSARRIENLPPEFWVSDSDLIFSTIQNCSNGTQI